MASKKKVSGAQGQEPVNVRRVTIAWPEFFAEATIAIAVKPGTSNETAHAMASSLLRLLITQDTLLNAMPQGESDAKA